MEVKSINAVISKAIDIDQKTLNDLNSAFAESLKDCSAQLDSVSIPGFGTFNSKKNDEKIVTDSQGNRSLIPPSIELSFRSSVLLRKKLRDEQ